MDHKAPAFQFYANDWLSSSKVALMTPEQRGAYIQLLCHDWSSDGIPDDEDALSRLSGMGEGWFKGGSRVVRECFNQHPTKDGFLTNKRLEEEREKQLKWRKKSSEGGRKSAESRAKNRQNPEKTTEKQQESDVEGWLPNGCEMVGTKRQPKVNSSSSSSSSINSNTLPKKQRRKTDVEHPLFAEWYRVYPRKIGRTSAEGAFQKAVKWICVNMEVSEAEAVAILVDRTEAWLPKLTNVDDQKFIPHPATWLNRGDYKEVPQDFRKVPKFPTPEEMENITLADLQ